MFPTDSLSTAKSEEARSAFIMLAASSASRNSCSSLRATFSSLVVSMKVLVKVKLFRGEVVGDPRGDDLGKLRGVDRGEDLGALPILFGRLSLFERTNGDPSLQRSGDGVPLAAVATVSGEELLLVFLYLGVLGPLFVKPLA